MENEKQTFDFNGKTYTVNDSVIRTIEALVKPYATIAVPVVQPVEAKDFSLLIKFITTKGNLSKKGEQAIVEGKLGEFLV